MKVYLCLVALMCALGATRCWRFVDEQDLMPARAARRLYDDSRLDELASNEDDVLDSLAYRRALAALAAEQQQQQTDSSSDEIVESLSERDDTGGVLHADPRDEETESHSSLIAGHQYVSGGAGEGRQHLHPDGAVANKEEVKSDEDLPAYCDPPNPCPVGYEGEDCDPRPFDEYTAEFSKAYQEQQNCMCDDDHNECKRSAAAGVKAAKEAAFERIGDLLQSMQMAEAEKYSPVVAKKSPRFRRSIDGKRLKKLNPYLRGEALKIHMAKKLAPL